MEQIREYKTRHKHYGDLVYGKGHHLGGIIQQILLRPLVMHTEKILIRSLYYIVHKNKFSSRPKNLNLKKKAIKV